LTGPTLMFGLAVVFFSGLVPGLVAFNSLFQIVTYGVYV